MSAAMEDLRALCEQMVQLERERDALQDQLAENTKALDALRLGKIPDFMTEQGIKNATFDGLGRVQLASDIYASTRSGQKEAAMQWLRDCGYDGMISETYNASSLKALLRRMIADGNPTPDDLFSVVPFIRASIVKG